METSPVLQAVLLVVGAGSAREPHANGRTAQRCPAPEINRPAARFALHTGDATLKRRLELLGYQVVVRGGAYAKATEAQGKALVLISSTVNAPEVKATFREVHVPVVVAEPMLFDDMGMVETMQDQGRTSGQRHIKIPHSHHPMAAELAGTVTISKEVTGLAWGKPRPEALPIAMLPDEDDKAVIFGYESGVAMDGWNAPARRVAFFLDDDAAEHLTPEGWALFDAAIDWAVGEQVKQFGDVFRKEWREVYARRKQQRYAEASTADLLPETDAPRPPRNLTGLALSGGGIRSATFCLGVLQALHKQGMLRCFDYLSTVSGGGFVGGWWSAWLSRHSFTPTSDASPLFFSEAGPKQPYHFILRLSRDCTPLSKALWERLTATRSLVAKLAQPLTLEVLRTQHGLQAVLVKELDQLIKDENFYQDELFASVVLTEKTYLLLRDNLEGDQCVQLNRLLLEEAYPEELGSGIFPPPEENELHRVRGTSMARQPQPAETRQEVTADLLCAGHDPIHHLRLFANYLTPRKGALSADTWRAVAEIGRNLVLTWCILLPLLFATILAGQCYFVLYPGQVNDFLPHYTDAWQVSTSQILWERALLMAWPLGGLGGWLVILTFTWIILSGNPTGWRDTLVGAASASAALLMLYCVVRFSSTLSASSWHAIPDVWSYVFASGAIILLCWTFVPHALPLPSKDPQVDQQRRRNLRRSQIVRAQGYLLGMLVLTAFVLAVAGFGHEVANYLAFDPRTEPAHWIAKQGGWAGLLLAIGGAIFTALKATPTGGGDRRAKGKPGLLYRSIFAVTPPLVLLVLAVLIAWGAHVLLVHIKEVHMQDAHISFNTLRNATCIGIALAFLCTLLETRWRKTRLMPWLCAWWLLWLLLTTMASVDAGQRALWHITGQVGPWLAAGTSRIPLVGGILLVAYLIGSVLCLRLLGDENRKLGWSWWSLGCWVSLTLAAVWGAWQLLAVAVMPSSPGFLMFIMGGLLLCGLLTWSELCWGSGKNQRGLWLLCAVHVALTALLIVHMLPEQGDKTGTVFVLQARLALIEAALSWVIVLGWTADPNALTLHAFYKARLVRAYLGASNYYRSARLQDITEAVAGDDLFLKNLENCRRGAPYHLINTTLNLVGGRDLTTAQRTAANFVLSKEYCGSSRTGYRNTQEYMNGQLSLGTAVAVSGAAASPNMGSRTPTSALAMLMTLCNVRLGYWAPTPNKVHWRSPQARLWPFYTLREFLSQTNDLSSYCYLTDGGHFDNTGLYALVERGCRYIVLVDCGADPQPCFEDLGEAIRRCRIDFHTEISLDLTPFKPKEEGSLRHCVVGEILYDEEHVKCLNWRDTCLHERQGILIWIKPSLLKPELARGEAADVQQYGMQNITFPQQTTADQWFDEMQFESYRRLGQCCARDIFKPIEACSPLSLRRVSAAFEEAQRRCSEPASSLQNTQAYEGCGAGLLYHRSVDVRQTVEVEDRALRLR